MKLLKDYYSLVFNGVWMVITLIGYFFWSWDIGQTILFLTISFFSLFFNHYLALCELTYKNTFRAALEGTITHPDLGQPLVVIWQFFTFVCNAFLFTFALAVTATISGAIIAAFFYKVLKVEDFEQFVEKWDGQWTNVILTAGIILVLEFIGFRRELRKLNVHGIKDWNIFLPTAKNTKLKVITYGLGSTLAIIVDGIVSDWNNFGTICLVWLFICNFIWSYIDMNYKSVALPLEAYQEVIE
jgi:hypothetical protein